RILPARSVANPASRCGNLPIRVDRGQAIACVQCDDATALVEEYGIGTDVENVGPVARECREGTVDLTVIANVKTPGLQPDRLCRRRHDRRIRRTWRIVGVYEKRNRFCFWDQFV